MAKHKKIIKYTIICINCKKELIRTNQPNQLPCECGSRFGVYRNKLVGWVWSDKPY